MTALATIAPRLRKLLLMLSSSADGEVVGAARAIGRALRGAGADWHALAGLLTEPLQPRKAPRADDDAFAGDGARCAGSVSIVTSCCATANGNSSPASATGAAR